MGNLVSELEDVCLLAERHEMPKLRGSYLVETYINQM